MGIRAVQHRHRGCYGAPCIQNELAEQGARRFVPCTTQCDHDQPIALNILVQRPAPTGPNQAWVTDLTYVWTEEGWLFVAVILDLWSRRVVGWATAATLHASLATRALAMATCAKPNGRWSEGERWSINPKAIQPK
jgi:transposase InsO family protein